MVSDNPGELAVAAHNAYEQLQYNGHSLQHQVGHNWLHEFWPQIQFITFYTFLSFEAHQTAQRRSLDSWDGYGPYVGGEQVHRNSRHIAEDGEEEAIVYNPYVYKYLKHRKRKK